MQTIDFTKRPDTIYTIASTGVSRLDIMVALAWRCEIPKLLLAALFICTNREVKILLYILTIAIP
jgi:hypothetical protein